MRPRRTLTAEQRKRLQRLRNLIRWLDEAIRVPGTDVKVGLDGLVGLVPIAGDLVTGAMAIYVIRQAALLGAPRTILLQMIANVGWDILAGAVPVAGDVMDVLWKANKKNLALLEAHLKGQGLFDEDPYIDV